MFGSFMNDNYSFHETGDKLIPDLNFNHPETPHTLFKEASDSINVNDDAMKIYLRLRPLSTNQMESSYTLSDSSTIIARPPEQSHSFKNLLHGNGKGYQKFAFSKILTGPSNQEFVFNETCKNLLDDFDRGNDRLLFTYGTTSSGKTFTMNGKKHDVGIIPRSLHRLFKLTKLSNNPSIMPVDFCEISHLKQADVMSLLKEKSILLKYSDRESTEAMRIFDDICDLDLTAQDQSEDEINSKYETTFWISYTEIYNELIYDLLDPGSISNCSAPNYRLKRPILDIRSARTGGSYVKGLKTYPVYSAEEAYRLLLVGRRCQSMGATKLNQNSSRSHTILSIRAVRSVPGSDYLSRVTNMSFCDLAGSERTDKAQTSGISQKEAANINSSLLALGRCIDVLRTNQSNPKDQRVVPYRDSKLTRLFQTYLGGNGKAAMIVCINQDPILFDETLQVLKFSALARKVVLHEKEKPEPKAPGAKNRSSMYHRLGICSENFEGESSIDEDELEMNETLQFESEEEEQYDVNELIDIIERLKAELISTKKEKVANEARLRDEFNNQFSRTVMEMERDNARTIQELRQKMHDDLQKHTKIERRKAYLQLKKRKLEPEYQDSDDGETTSTDTMEMEYQNLSKKVEMLTTELTNVRGQLKEAEEEAVEATERADLLEADKNQLEARCQELRFQISLVQQIRPRAGKTIDMGVQCDMFISSTPCTKETPLISNCTAPPPQTHNRFSIVSANPLANAATKNKYRQVNNLQSNLQFFDPISTPTSTNGKSNNLFTICVDEDDEESDFSFQCREEQCKIEDLQDQLDQLQTALFDQTNLTKSLQSQLECRDKSIEYLVEKDAKISRKLDSLLRHLDATFEKDLPSYHKLQIFAHLLAKIQSGFDQINAIIATEEVSTGHDLTVDREASRIVAYIRQVQGQFTALQTDYENVMVVINEELVVRAESQLQCRMKRVRPDSSAEDIRSRFQKLWTNIVDVMADLTTQIDNLHLDKENCKSLSDTDSSSQQLSGSEKKKSKEKL